MSGFKPIDFAPNSPTNVAGMYNNSNNNSIKNTKKNCNEIKSDCKEKDLFDNKSVTPYKRCYRNLALKYHPDKGGDGEKFKLLNDCIGPQSEYGHKLNVNNNNMEIEEIMASNISEEEKKKAKINSQKQEENFLSEASRKSPDMSEKYLKQAYKRRGVKIGKSSPSSVFYSGKGSGVGGKKTRKTKRKLLKKNKKTKKVKKTKNQRKQKK